MRAVSPGRGRQPPFREPRLRLLVVCSGQRTEPDYFRGLKGHLRNPAVQIRLKTKVCAPRDLVEHARRIAPAGGDEFDQVWCVLDSDEFDLEPTVALAAKLDVRLAVSNPCFELWLLLHHQACAAPLCDDHGRDPSSGVWKLVRLIMEGGQLP